MKAFHFRPTAISVHSPNPHQRIDPSRGTQKQQRSLRKTMSALSSSNSASFGVNSWISMSDGVPPWLVDDPKEIAALWSAVEGITFTDDQPPTTEEINLQECRPFTNEEWDLYKKTLEESEGFDTIDLPANVAQTGVHVLLPVSEEEEPLEYANLIDDSQATINHYNNENGTNFEVVKVLKANWRLVEGAHVYITFQAENKTTGAFDNFQAIIYVFVGVREVQLVRLEPQKSQLLQESDKEARLDLPSKKKARLDLMSPSESKCTPRSLNSSL